MNRSLVKISLLLSILLLPVVALAEKEEIWDPLEPLNRKIFWFNDQLDFFLLKPIAQTYDFIVPDIAQTSVNNFFENLRSPIYLISDLLQGEISMFGNHFARLSINTTLGVAGLFDVATKFGFEPQSQDMGTTFGVWGIPHGPYLVAPIFGPMTLRTAVGRGLDLALYPPNYVGYSHNLDQRTKNSVTYGLQGLEIVQTRTDLLEGIEEAKSASVDYYLFIQNTYYQIQERRLRRGILEEFPEDEDFDHDDSMDEELQPDQSQ